MRAPAAGVAVLLSLVLVGCGEQTSDPPRDPAAAGWRTEHLSGEVSVDFPTLLVTEGDDALVLMLSDKGVLQSHVSMAGNGFEAGEPLDLGEKYAALGDVVRLDDGSWFALGNAGTARVEGEDEFTFDPLALRSDDGLVWERVDVTGFSDAVEFNDVQVAGDRIVAVGDYRTRGDRGGFEARAWTSEDGRSFTEVALPDVPVYQDYGDESVLGEVVIVGDELLAAGRIGDSAALWRSDDVGSSWTRVTSPALDGVYSIAGLGVDDSTVVAATVGTDTAAIRSTDGGATWAAVDALPVDEEAESWAPLWSGAGRFFTLTGTDDPGWSRPEVCYADLEQCGFDRKPGPSVVMSVDGAAWTAIDTPEGEEPWEIAGTEDGRVLVMAEERNGVAVHTWPAGTDLPEATEPTEPKTVELVTLSEDEAPEVGVRYHLPLYTHCGIETISFGNATWRRTDGGGRLDTGAGDEPSEGWPMVDQTLYGYATVDADGVLTYSAEDGTVLATYERGGRLFGCD